MKNILCVLALVNIHMMFAQTTTYNPSCYTNEEEMKITSIEIYEYKTVVKYRYSPSRDSKIYINSGTFIRENNNLYGRKYVITRFVGKELDQIYSVNSGKSYVITLEFPKIPNTFKTIEIREPENDDGWSSWYWSNIRINNRSNEYSSSVSHSNLPETKYGYGTIPPGGLIYWKYYVPAGTMPVLTLKNKGASSDFDIYVYSDENHNYLLESGTNSGVATELVSLSIYDYGRSVYIKIKNDGNYSSTYHLHAHYVDFVELGEKALVDAGAQYLLKEGIKWLLDIEDDNENESSNPQNISRASTLILSGLKGENLGSISKSLLINEITSELRDEFGYGFGGDLLVNYGINILDEVYKYYW